MIEQPEQVRSVKFDLLDTKLELKLQRQPERLRREIERVKPHWVIIDEVQKAPKLLDHVHQLIEETDVKFALTGSSARKLKRGSANLLVGRAFVFHLFPLTHVELGADFDLPDVLHWGGAASTYFE